MVNKCDATPGQSPEDLAAAARAEIEKWIGEDLAALRQPDGKAKEVLPRSGESLGGGFRPWSAVVTEGLRRIAIRAEIKEKIRYPLVRTGEREEIPKITRILVYARDNGRCRRCEARDHVEIDHVIPWSAGGPDTSNNLRLLCHDCNQQRSNFWLGDLPRIFPVIAACDYCLRDHPWPHGGTGYPLWEGCPICRFEEPEFRDYWTPAWCGTCGEMAYTSVPERLL